MATSAGRSFSEAIAGAPLRAFQVATFAICMLVLIADGMDAQLLGIVAPIVIEEFAVDRGTFGLAMSAALVGFGLGSWAGGWLGDTAGRRWSLALATVIFSLATIGASWSEGERELALDLAVWRIAAPEGVWELACWRLIGGLGFGSAYANAIALAGEWLPDRWRAVGVTTLSVGTPAGGLVVASLAPTLLEIQGWRGTFVAVGLVTLAVVLLIVFVLRDSPAFLLVRGKPEAAREAARKVLASDEVLVPERHMTDTESGSIGVLDRSNLRLNIGIGVAFAAATMIAYGMLNWGTTFLTLKGFDLDQAAYAVAVGGATSIAGSIAVGLLVQQLGSRLVIAALSAGLVAALFAMMLFLEGMSAAPGETELIAVVALYGLSAALFSASIASFYALMTHAYPPSCRSAGIGFGIFVGRVGAIAATGFGGWLIDLGEGSLVPFFGVLSAGAALISAAAFVVDRAVPPARSPRRAG